MAERAQYQNPNWLREKYWKEELSLSQIAILGECSIPTIWRYMERFHIPRRTLSESKRGDKNPSWGKKRSPETRRKISESSRGRDLRGERAPNWKGGRRYNSRGYILIWTSDHPNRDSQNYMLEHRLIVEEVLGRYLESKELVHHINGVHDDNRLENLRLVSHHNETICPHCGWPKENMLEYSIRKNRVSLPDD